MKYLLLALLFISSSAVAQDLTGKPLRYLIGADSAGDGCDNCVTEAPYGAKPARRGVSIAYGNLFDEENTGRYGPYLNTSDTAKKYDEGQIDPRGLGWVRNLMEQFELRRRQGFEYIELDNPDAYEIQYVINAIEHAQLYGLKVIAKNPSLFQKADALLYAKHPNVFGAIVERDAGSAPGMNVLRRDAGKPNLPVWFVAFGRGKAWANNVAKQAKNYKGMGVTYSTSGEYVNAVNILVPK